MFEKYYKEDPPRERVDQIERHVSIERNYRDLFNKEHSAELVYKPPLQNEELLDENSALGKKYKKAKELLKETKVLDLNEKSKSKIPKRKSKKNNNKSNKATMESVQEKL